MDKPIETEADLDNVMREIMADIPKKKKKTKLPPPKRQKKQPKKRSSATQELLDKQTRADEIQAKLDKEKAAKAEVYDKSLTAADVRGSNNSELVDAIGRASAAERLNKLDKTPVDEHLTINVGDITPSTAKLGVLKYIGLPDGQADKVMEIIGLFTPTTKKALKPELRKLLKNRGVDKHIDKIAEAIMQDYTHVINNIKPIALPKTKVYYHSKDGLPVDKAVSEPRGLNKYIGKGTYYTLDEGGKNLKSHKTTSGSLDNLQYIEIPSYKEYMKLVRIMQTKEGGTIPQADKALKDKLRANGVDAIHININGHDTIVKIKGD